MALTKISFVVFSLPIEMGEGKLMCTLCLSVCLSAYHALILQQLSGSWHNIGVIEIKNNWYILVRFQNFVTGI